MSLENDINQGSFRNLNQKSMVNIIYTYHWIVERIKQFLAEEDITLQQYNILRILRGSFPKPLSTLQIRERMLDKMSDTSRIVDRLRVKGLVQKSVARTDKRLVDVLISDKGKKLLEGLDMHNHVLDGIIHGFSDAEMQELNRLLDKLRE
jgi:MarR family transcriptional regulator, 2-MHQ and catechol-resistance regulon repressor